jgi:hypothetical protein
MEFSASCESSHYSMKISQSSERVTHKHKTRLFQEITAFTFKEEEHANRSEVNFQRDFLQA